MVAHSCLAIHNGKVFLNTTPCATHSDVQRNFTALIITLKKDGLDADMFGNYRPVSNLNTISKIVERVYLARLSAHVKQSPNFNRFQSAYRRGHNTETALLRMLNDVYSAADRGSRTMLLQLDLSSAFDTLDISTMLRRLRFTFGVSGPVLNWISSYMALRKQSVRVGIYPVIYFSHLSWTVNTVCLKDPYSDQCCSLCTLPLLPR